MQVIKFIHLGDHPGDPFKDGVVETDDEALISKLRGNRHFREEMSEIVRRQELAEITDNTQLVENSHGRKWSEMVGNGQNDPAQKPSRSEAMKAAWARRKAREAAE